MIIAIDGPGGTGKSTVSREVASRLGLPHLDTGAYYRAATLAVLREGADPEDPDEVLQVVGQLELDQVGGRMFMAGRDITDQIREKPVDGAVSSVSAHQPVRRVLVRLQRDWVARHGGSAVVEGRDIGTVVFPMAQVKVYLDATPEIRARRRALEKGVDPDVVAEELARRDQFDSTREASPLRVSDDAHVIDTTELEVADVVDRIVALAEGQH